MCFEGLARLSRRVWRRFVRGSREISLVPSLHRASTDALIWCANRLVRGECMSMTKPNSTNCRVVKGCMSNNLCVCHCSSTDGLTTTATSPQATSLAVSWTPERTLTANGYTISYSNTNDGCFTDSRSGITTRMKSYVLTGLEEGTEYSITVTATLTGGRTEEDTITASTRTAG